MRTVDIKEQEIFLQAIEIPSSIMRTDFICQACGNNENLRMRVMSLLELQDTSEFILDKQIGLNVDGEITSDVLSVADLTGTTVDKYHLVRLIGSGGMGDVYLAEQREPIRRRVAVKVIKLGLDTKNFVARFAAERQTLALMDHQGITKVFDAGSTKSGRPFLVMELVSGEPITECCDENSFTIEKRLEVFLLLCKSIQHAHQKGVIHRDLKPSNILVALKDGDFAPKVIDFGIAKATANRIKGQTDLTQLACMIGTPEYMSPEQTDTQGNDQDIRTDLYSLGSVLYELLTGSTPFELENLKSLNLLSVREIIQTRGVESPSTRVMALENTKPQIFRNRATSPKQLASALSGDLDAIVSKCLNKDRAERYPSVADLARDISRHLAGEQVDIVPGSWVSDSIRIFKRRKKFVLTALAVAITLLSTTAISLISSVRANRYADKAIGAELLAEERLSEGNKARQAAQLERSRSSMIESQAILKQRELTEQQIVLMAIARFNKGDDKLPAEISDTSQSRNQSRNRFVSTWLRNRLGQRLSRLLPADKTETVEADQNRAIPVRLPQSNSGDSDRNDISLLELILEEQRLHYGKSELELAPTMDLLGEKYLAMGHLVRSEALLRESLFIRTNFKPGSEDRVWTMILLSNALRRSGATLEAQTYLESATKLVDRLPQDSRFRKLILQVDK